MKLYIGIFTLILLLVVSLFSSKPYIIKHSDISVASSHEIYIVSHGWHTGIVVPASTIQKQLPQLKMRFHDIPFIEFGWGDKNFYQTPEITFSLALQALLWPTESVMHTVAVPIRPEIFFSNSETVKLCLNSKQFSLLTGFIEQSFYKDNDNKIVKLTHGIYGDSQFYKGEGHYHLMNTSNKWTAKGLKSARLDIAPTFKLTADSIMDYLSDYKKTQTGDSCVTTGSHLHLSPSS